MLPGKKYTPEDILQIGWRHKWFLLLPFAIVSAGTAVYTRYLPDRYLSEALIMVVPQRVPESYVRSTVTTRIEDRLRAITEQIMSRTRLERVILEFNLYAEQRRTGIMQDVVERMQREVTVRPGPGDTFRVGFMGDNPVVVRKVAEKITSLFIDESLRQRESLAEGTNQFLDAQLEDARARLIDHEKRREAYRMQYAPELPEQRDANLQAAADAQLQIQQLLQAVNRGQDRRLALEKQVADLEAENFAPAPAAAVTTPEAMTSAQRLVLARQQLSAMLKEKTPQHPDVVAAQRIVAEFERKAEEDALRMPLSAGDDGLPPVERARRRRIADLRAELEQLDRQLAGLQAEETRLRGVGGEYQRRAETAPRRESEMIELTRDYAIISKQYTDLLAKREDAKISANLERRQIGEQFEVLDPARLPERPFSPNRERLNLIGMAAGLAVGLALVALLEYRDRSFKTDDEIKAVLQLPVLAVVPLMRSEIEKRRRWRRGVLVNMFLGSAVLACFAVVAYTFVR